MLLTYTDLAESFSFPARDGVPPRGGGWLWATVASVFFFSFLAPASFLWSVSVDVGK